jgi:hypothetical protein
LHQIRSLIGNVSGANQPLRTTIQTSNLGHMMLNQATQGVDNFTLNHPLLITLFQIPPPTPPHAPLDQHHVIQIKILHGCTKGLICTRYVPLSGMYLVQTNPSVQPYKLLIEAT